MGKLPFKVDWRFAVAFKQMVITYVTQVLFTVVIVGIGYGMGGAPLKSYGLVLGIPSWWFLMMAAGLAFIALIAYMCLRVFPDIPTDDYID